MSKKTGVNVADRAGHRRVWKTVALFDSSTSFARER